MDARTGRCLRHVAGLAALLVVSVGCGREQAALVGAPVREGSPT